MPPSHYQFGLRKAGYTKKTQGDGSNGTVDISKVEDARMMKDR